MTQEHTSPLPAPDQGSTPSTSPDFASLGLGPVSLAAISQKGFELPTRIQADVIPLLLGGQHDVIAQSHTGTGKTAAFGLPLLELLQPGIGHVQALVMVPTRELALQVSEELNSLKGSRRFHICPIYGGQSYELQFRHLKQGVDILVGTPGRLIDHLQRGSLNLSKISHMVLDEADEMLDMGFIDDIEAILGTCNADKRMLLFSATMPPRIRQIAETWMREPKKVEVKGSALTTSLTSQQYIEVREEDKFEALCRIIDHAPEFYGMIFCRTKVESDRVYTRLLERGYTAEVLHGDVSQGGREKVLDAFRRRFSEILVATDVAARGIDVEGLTHVINYELPQDPESYVHRIGRTGRAGREGTAITFISPREFRKLQFIQKHARGEIKKEKLPRIEDIMEQKRTRLVQQISDKLQEDDGKSASEYAELAQELLELKPDGKALEPKEILIALLKHQLADLLDSSRYAEIQEPDFRNKGGYGDRQGGGYGGGGGGYRNGPPRRGGYNDRQGGGYGGGGGYSGNRGSYGGNDRSGSFGGGGGPDRPAGHPGERKRSGPPGSSGGYKGGGYKGGSGGKGSSNSSNPPAKGPKKLHN